jgi:hypothetical protein|tara:strand:+ start:39 stop:374 length:336 start_codon:yes stop_codon:yes gene_type:complete
MNNKSTNVQAFYPNVITDDKGNEYKVYIYKDLPHGETEGTERHYIKFDTDSWGCSPSYYLHTILCDWHTGLPNAFNQGLCLHGGLDTNISDSDMGMIREWGWKFINKYDVI